MSLQIIKGGMLDTIRDEGRFGFQYAGINPGGAMDVFSMRIANILVGNNMREAVIEMHFPSSVILFQQDTIIALSGADFTPVINEVAVPLHKPIHVYSGSILKCKQLKKGARCYLALKGGMNIPAWLHSSSTNTRVGLDGIIGRTIHTDDIISYKNEIPQSLHQTTFHILPWMAGIKWDFSSIADDTIYILPGHEWGRLTDEAKKDFTNEPFRITALSDRMGYQLEGKVLYTDSKEEIISSAVCFGTIQLLPGGQLIVLMADHQTTGGYPRAAHVITSHLSKLAQMKAGDKIRFQLTDIKTAEEFLVKQERHLQQLQLACSTRLQEYLNQS